MNDTLAVVKILVLLCVFLGLTAFPVAAQDRDGDFTIRFEPTAKLQSNTEVPFQISVIDSRHKPVEHANVLLQIKDKDSMNVRDFKAIMTAPGMYLAKPSFSAAGEWSVYVEVRRDGLMTARTISFVVTE